MGDSEGERRWARWGLFRTLKGPQRGWGRDTKSPVGEVLTGHGVLLFQRKTVENGSFFAARGSLSGL